MNKNEIKNKALIFGIFMVGMLAVSIANFFGGYYCSVLAIVAILSTIYVFNVLDLGNIKDNKVDIGLVALLSFLEFVFFVANDIFGHPVYVKGNVDFFGGLVIGSQIYSIAVILYNLIKIDLSLFKHKDTVELVEEKKEMTTNEGIEYDTEESLFEDNKDVEDIKRIPRSDIRKDAPFMEEEK